MAQSDGTATEYFTADGLGSVRQLTDSTGSALLNQTFDPYGNPYVRTGPGDTRFGFTGEQVDGNGLVYLRARYYQPEMGRFLNADPSRQERNPYQYAMSNPVLFTDPSGKHYCDSPYADPVECARLIDSDDRELTTWLIEAMNTNAASSEVQKIRELNISGNVAGATTLISGGVAVVTAVTGVGSVVAAPCAAASVLAGMTAAETKSTAYLMWYGLVGDGARWDFKDAIKREMNESIRLSDTQQSRWYEYSTPGNIHYAYVGRAAGFSSIELHAGATFAQQTDPENIPEQNAWHGDQPSDFAAIEFGAALYSNCARPLSMICFTQTLDSYRTQLARASRPREPYYNEIYGTQYPVTFFDGSGS